MFLPNFAPPSLFWLTSFLRKNKELEIKSSVQNRLFLRRRRCRLEADLEIMYKYFYSIDKLRLKCLFVRGMDRPLDPLLMQDSLWDGADPHIFLDYLPMLRVISLLEETYHRALHQISPQADEPPTGRKRSTRNSRRNQQSMHYLSSLIPACALKENQSVQRIGGLLARNTLSKITV